MVDRLRQEYGTRIELEWQAFELRPEPVPLRPPGDPERVRRWQASVLPMAAERGLVMKIPPITTRTRLTFQAVELARDHRKFDAMHRAIFEAFFRDGRDIGDAHVLADIAASIDLAPALVIGALEAGTYLGRVLDQEQLSRQLGITGVPTLFIGEDLQTAEPVVGAVPYDSLRAVVERVARGVRL